MIMLEHRRTIIFKKALVFMNPLTRAKKAKKGCDTSLKKIIQWLLMFLSCNCDHKIKLEQLLMLSSHCVKDTLVNRCEFVKLSCSLFYLPFSLVLIILKGKSAVCAMIISNLPM